MVSLSPPPKLTVVGAFNPPVNLHVIFKVGPLLIGLRRHAYCDDQSMSSKACLLIADADRALSFCERFFKCRRQLHRQREPAPWRRGLERLSPATFHQPSPQLSRSVFHSRSTSVAGREVMPQTRAFDPMQTYRDAGGVLVVGLCVGATVGGGGGAGIFSRISWFEVRISWLEFCRVSIWCTIWS
jgi:hypothetical protein